MCTLAFSSIFSCHSDILILHDPCAHGTDSSPRGHWQVQPPPHLGPHHASLHSAPRPTPSPPPVTGPPSSLLGPQPSPSGPSASCLTLPGAHLVHDEPAPGAAALALHLTWPPLTRDPLVLGLTLPFPPSVSTSPHPALPASPLALLPGPLGSRCLPALALVLHVCPSPPSPSTPRVPSPSFSFPFSRVELLILVPCTHACSASSAPGAGQDAELVC